MATTKPAEDVDLEGLSLQQVRARIEALRQETALLAGQPTFELRSKTTQRRQEELRRKLRALEERYGR